MHDIYAPYISPAPVICISTEAMNRTRVHKKINLKHHKSQKTNDPGKTWLKGPVQTEPCSNSFAVQGTWGPPRAHTCVSPRERDSVVEAKWTPKSCPKVKSAVWMCREKIHSICDSVAFQWRRRVAKSQEANYKSRLYPMSPAGFMIRWTWRALISYEK